MTKWDYIRLISVYGDRYGCNFGVYDLLIWCNKNGTCDVTEEEAKSFYEMIKAKDAEEDKKKRGFSSIRKAREDHNFIYLGGR